MKNKLSLGLLTLAVSVGMLIMTSAAQAHHCVRIHGHWHHGHWVHTHTVCCMHTHACCHSKLQCTWVPGYWKHGYWHPVHQVCWR